MLADPSEGYGAFSPLVRAHATTASAATLLEKGDYFIVLNLPHAIVNGDVVAEDPLAEANPDPGELFGTIKIEHMLEHHPIDVFEVLACTSEGEGGSGRAVQAKLIKSYPAPIPLHGYSPEVTSEADARPGTIISFVWDDEINVVLRASDQMILSAGGTPRVRRVAEASGGLGAGKQTGVFNGEMKDIDGMMLFCLDKANYIKEEKRSRPLRRGTGPERAVAFLGEKGYVLDIPRIRRELGGAFSDPMSATTSLPTWAVGVTDFATKVHSLPAWEDPKIFESLLLCEGTMSESSELALRHFLPTAVKYDVNSTTVLEIALERLDCLLAHTFDPSFYRQSDTYRDRINGGNLCKLLPKHLWYAGERALVQWQRIMRGEILELNDQFRMENRLPGQAARIWRECLEENFSLTFIKQVRDEWEVILARRQLEASTKMARPEKTASEGTGDPVKKKTRLSPESGSVMCTNFARGELKVTGAGGCKTEKCQFQHYKLGTMRLEAAKEVIRKHATPKQTAGLLTAAEKSLQA